MIGYDFPPFRKDAATMPIGTGGLLCAFGDDWKLIRI